MYTGVLTFVVKNCEVGIGGTQAEGELVPNERFICVHSAYCLYQLLGEELYSSQICVAVPMLIVQIKI